ncbi:MAG: hypothetical protein H3Z51_05600 [archaeon]|nr:hypothetical protein [archaeon]
MKPVILDFYQDLNGRCRYVFTDSSRKSHDLVCRDWEITGLLSKYPSDFGKVKQKFLNWMLSRDTYFVIGTTSDNLNKMVVAIHYPPRISIHS